MMTSLIREVFRKATNTKGGESMNLEKFGLLFLINYFNQLGTVKNHLQLAFKEVLLAMHSSFEIVNQTVGKSILGKHLDIITPLLGQVQGVLDYTIEKVTPVDASQNPLSGEEHLRIKEHIVNSIISAIDEEIENISETTSEKNKLKVEALQTVKQVLVHQKEKSVRAAESMPAKSAVA